METERAFLHRELHREVVQPFLKDAFKEGAHRIRPKRRLEDQWTRRKQIGIFYSLTPADLEDLKNAYGLNSKERARQIKAAFLRDLWNNCSLDLKDRYPLDEVLAARKPWSQKAREKSSLRKGGISFRIKAEVEKGVTDISKISEHTGISRKRIRSVASTNLKDWGINLPDSRKALYKGALQQLKEEIDDEKSQQLLDQLPYATILKDINISKRLGQTPHFLALRTLAMDAGFHYQFKYTDLFASSLRKAGIPITIKRRYTTIRGSPVTLTYWILCLRDKERAKQVLREDQDLQKFQKTTL